MIPKEYGILTLFFVFYVKIRSQIHNISCAVWIDPQWTSLTWIQNLAIQYFIFGASWLYDTFSKIVKTFLENVCHLHWCFACIETWGKRFHALWLLSFLLGEFSGLVLMVFVDAVEYVCRWGKKKIFCDWTHKLI